MKPLVELLPWRLAAVAGLLVGAVCGVAGIDVWAALARVGITFGAFAIGGAVLRAFLEHVATAKKPPGARIDQTTPPMSVEDVSRPANSPGRRGDENET